MRYIRYLTKSDPANAQVAIQRAQQVHCKQDAALHLFAAKYLESSGERVQVWHAFQIDLM